MEEDLEIFTQASFVRKVDHTSAAVVTDYSQRSNRMIIAFGGLKGFRAIPALEFSNILHDVPVKKIFVRDFAQAWYQAGLPGLADDIDGIATYLRREIEEQQISHLMLIGNSMGGYAALLFGALLGADAAVAIAPQTSFTLKNRLMNCDIRWFAQYQQALKYNREPKYADLRSILLEKSEHNHNMHIHYSGFVDTKHARNLQGLGINMYSSHKGDHDLVRHMRSTGQLRKVILDGLGVKADSV